MNESSVRYSRNGSSEAAATMRSRMRSARDRAVTTRSRSPEPSLDVLHDGRRRESKMLRQRRVGSRRAEPGHPDAETVRAQELAPGLGTRRLDHGAARSPGQDR